MQFLVLMDIVSGCNLKPETGIHLFDTYEKAYIWLIDYIKTDGYRVLRASIINKSNNIILYQIEKKTPSPDEQYFEICNSIFVIKNIDFI